jgi:hypothetical protein
MSITLTNVNIFLRSDTPEGLIELQLINNALNGVHYNYQTPTKDGDGWLVWFFADVNRWQDPTGLTADEISIVRGSA